MERLPRIIMMLIAMTGIFLWVMLAFNSCGDKDELGVEETVLVDDASDVFSDDLGEDIFGDDGDEDEDFLFSENESEEDEDDDYETDFTSAPQDDPEPAYTTPKKTPKRTTSNSSGEYMVIAGNYLVETNANQMIRKLRNLGYNNAEIGVFERSQYHTVIASRHSSNSAAISASNDIKYKGVDCYVKRKTY